MLQKGKLNYGTVHDLLSLKHTCVLTLCIILSIRASELLQLLSCRQVSWPIGWADIDLFRRFFTNWQWGWSFVKIKKGIKRKTIRRTCHTKNLISIEKFNQPNIVLILYGTQKCENNMLPIVHTAYFGVTNMPLSVVNTAVSYKRGPAVVHKGRRFLHLVHKIVVAYSNVTRLTLHMHHPPLKPVGHWWPTD